eukprot:scaffold38061_cov134-Skeletonema_marinoi.AAC.1
MHQQFIRLLDSTFYWHIRKAASIEADVEIAELFVSRAYYATGGPPGGISRASVDNIMSSLDTPEDLQWKKTNNYPFS